MPGGDYLTSTQVGDLIGGTRPEARTIAAWARARHIRPTTAGRRVLHPATLVRWHAAQDRRTADRIAAELRLRRWTTLARIV